MRMAARWTFCGDFQDRGRRNTCGVSVVCGVDSAGGVGVWFVFAAQQSLSSGASDVTIAVGVWGVLDLKIKSKQSIF